MACLIVVEKKPPANPWIKESDFPPDPLKIEFNNNLTDEEQEWFNELLIARLYPNFAALQSYGKILKGWKNASENGKIDQIVNLINKYWELKMAFNYVLPMEDKHLSINYDKKTQITEKNMAFHINFSTHYDYLYVKTDKIRKTLTKVVEKRAIQKKTYKFVLYALYMYRTKFKVSNEPTPIPYLMSIFCDAEEYVALILKTREGSDEQAFALKLEAFEKFCQHFRTYVIQVYKQQDVQARRLYGDREHPTLKYQCLINVMDNKKQLTLENLIPFHVAKRDTGVHLRQTRDPDVHGGKFTPFQLLLGNVCTALSVHCVDALLEFKQHLLNLSTFAKFIIYIGIKEECILGLSKERRRK